MYFYRKKTSIIIFLFLFLAPSCIDAQETLIKPTKFTPKFLVRAFSEEGTITGGVITDDFRLPLNYYRYSGVSNPDSNFIMDAKLRAQYYMLENDFEFRRDENGDYKFIGNDIPERYMIQFAANIDVRIIPQFSGPVRTPSFMGGGRVFFLIGNNKEKILSKKFKEFHNFYLGYYHYSNGQDGATLASNANLLPEFQYINANHALNVYNGSFGTNFVNFGYNYYFNHQSGSDEHWHNMNIDSEFHTNGVDPDLQGYFSRLKLALNYSIISLKPSEDPIVECEEYRRFKFHFEYRPLDTSLLPNSDFFTDISSSITYFFKLPLSTFTAWYMQAGFQGSDDYNIYLEDKNFYFQIGIATGNFIYK